MTASTPLTHSILNQLGNPQVTLPDGSIGADEIDAASVKAALGDGASNANYFLNPNFSAVKWTRGTTPVTCPATEQTYRADDWWATPAGAAVTYERVQAGPNNLSLHSAQLTGATSVTTVDFGQDIPSHIATGLCAAITVSIHVYNNTGATLTPSLRIDTANSLDVFSAVTNRVNTASSTPQSTATWQKHTWQVDLSAVPACANGLRVALRFASGSLNAGGKTLRIAQAKIELGSTATQFVVPLEEEASTETAAAESPSAAVREFLRNPDFRADLWRTTAAITCTNTIRIYGPESWWVNAAGGGNTARLQRDTMVPSTLSLHSAKITGGAGTNEVDFGQEFPSHLAAAMRRDMAVAIWFYNGTGASITPNIRIDTYDAADNPAAVTNRVNETLESCPDGAWTRLEHTFDGSGLTNFVNGFRLYWRVPSGALDVGTEVVRFAQASLAPGLTALDFSPPGPQPPAASVTGAALGLTIASASVSTLTVAAAEIILKDDAGDAIRVVNLSGTVNIANSDVVNGRDGFTEGADTWYYIWAISNGATAGGLLSSSSSSPTLPPGYRYKALIGCVFNNAGQDFRAFSQSGREVATAGVEAFDQIATDPEVMTLTNFIPPIACRVEGFLAPESGIRVAVRVSNNATLADWRYFMAETYGGVNYDGYRGGLHFDIPILNPPALTWGCASAPTDVSMVVTGYTLR